MASSARPDAGRSWNGRSAIVRDGLHGELATQPAPSAILLLADALGSLAADLWFAGKLEHPLREGEQGDDD